MRCSLSWFDRAQAAFFLSVSSKRRDWDAVSLSLRERCGFFSACRWASSARLTKSIEFSSTKDNPDALFAAFDEDADEVTLSCCEMDEVGAPPAIALPVVLIRLDPFGPGAPREAYLDAFFRVRSSSSAASSSANLSALYTLTDSEGSSASGLAPSHRSRGGRRLREGKNVSILTM